MRSYLTNPKNLGENEMIKTQKFAIAAALVAAAVVPGLAGAQETPWSVRVGLTELHMANKSDAFTALGLNFPADSVHVNNKAIPEFDIYYTYSPNIVAQLVLTVPQKQEVTLYGPTNGADLGSFKHLPPSLVAQYHFLPGQQLDPYVGVGVNFTWISSVHLSVAGNQLDLKKSSFGAVLDIGGDFNVDKRWFVNADIKLITPLQSDVSVGGTKLTTAKLDPILYSLGVGYHF
jgi:outer membrane protein